MVGHSEGSGMEELHIPADGVPLMGLLACPVVDRIGLLLTHLTLSPTILHPHLATLLDGVPGEQLVAGVGHVLHGSDGVPEPGRD